MQDALVKFAQKGNHEYASINCIDCITYNNRKKQTEKVIPK